MSLGQNLKRIRLFRKVKSSELGLGLGFSSKTAHVRISQYESDKKVPKKEMIDSLAFALDVSPLAIDIPDIDTYYGAMYTLFQLERNYGLHIDTLDGEPILRFDKNIKPHQRNQLYKDMLSWANELKESNFSAEQYEEWKYNYPKYSTSISNNKDRNKWLEKYINNDETADK